MKRKKEQHRSVDDEELSALKTVLEEVETHLSITAGSEPGETQRLVQGACRSTSSSFRDVERLCVEEGHDLLLAFLCDHFRANVGTADADGLTAAHDAVAEGNERALELLIAAGGDHLLDARSKVHQRTALHFAIELQHHGCVRLLLEGQAQIDARDDMLMAPMDYALSNQDVEAVSILLRLSDAAVRS